MLRTTGVRPVTAVAPAAIFRKSRRVSVLGIISLSVEGKGLLVAVPRPGLFMAGQAVLQAGDPGFVLLRVAIQTPAHVHLHHGSRDRHLTDISVAGFTILTGSQVSLVAEVNEFWLLAYAYPRDGLAAFPIAG